MNKFLTPNGGMPIFGDDFAYLDAAYRDGFKGILHELALSAPVPGNMVLGGCELTIVSGTVTLSAGYLLLDNEVFFYAGQSWPVASGTTGVFSTSISTDTAGNRMFANGTTQSPWQKRIAVFTPTTSPSGGDFELGVLPRLSALIYNKMLNLSVSSAAFTMVNGWAKSAAPNDPLLSKHFKQVSWAGNFDMGTITNTSWTLITTLPAGFRPAKRVRQPVMVNGLTAPFNGIIFFDIYTNGEVYVQNQTTTAWTGASINITFQT